jgi:type IV pilus assembly protein PilO
MAQEGMTKSLDPLFESVEKLSKGQRIAICVVTFVLIIGCFVWFLILPKYKAINNLKIQYGKLSKELATAKKNAEDLNKFRAKIKKAEIKFKQVMKSLPEKEEIPTLLSGISQSGQDTGLYFLLFKPIAEKKKEFYAEIPVAMEVTGYYHNIAMFFDKVARLPRIVNIKDITVERIKSGRGTKGASAGDVLLRTRCKAVTYKFIEPTKKKKKVKRRRRKK